MSKRYAWQKFYEAVRSLATSNEPLATRLSFAFNYLSSLRKEQLPPALQQEFAELYKGPRGESLARMSGEDLEALAQRIFHIFCHLPNDFEVAQYPASHAPRD
jgi:hypothetical protein